MIISRLTPFSSESDINEILNGDTIDIVSPFYSAWSINKLNLTPRKRIRLITRLPLNYYCAHPFLENDPYPLRDAMNTMRSSLSVFALPTVHSKLYINNGSAWLGSANFTRNGFSGKAEIISKIDSNINQLKSAFIQYISLSKQVNVKEMDFLCANVKLGITRIPQKNNADEASGDEPMFQALSYEAFQDWLRGQTGASHILERISNKNRMSGHVYSGYHGIFSFILKNPQLGHTILDSNYKINGDILDHLSSFVKKFGSKFGGPRGGTWNSKLSTRLGGEQLGGGAGDVVVKNLLPLVVKFMKENKLI